MLFPFENFHPDVPESVFVAPTAVIIGRTHIGEGSSIWFHTVVRADINRIDIGMNTNIQDGCLLHVTNKHGLFVGDRVTVGHGAILHGCRVEADCLISMGAVVLDGAVVGAGSIIAAGAVVAPGSQIPAGSLAMGVPAKVVRQVTDDDRHKIDRGWQNYLHYSGIYRGMTLKVE
jgi:carbonic anhydrase/acetyltransferase-like protein (isoleucine patch superfamily)